MDQPGVLAAFVLFCALFGVGTWLLADSLGWRRLPAVLASAGLALAVAVTLVRSGGHWPDFGVNPVAVCLRDGFSLTGGLAVLNFVMLMPFAFFAALATRHPARIMVASALVSAGIEITQAWTGLGVCQTQDFLNNTIGATVAAGLAWLLMALLDRRTPAQQYIRPLERV